MAVGLTAQTGRKQGVLRLERISFGHTRVTSVTHYSGGAPHVDSLDHPHRHPRAGPARLLRPRPLLGLTSRRGGSAVPALPALPYEPALRHAGPRIEQRLVFRERFRHLTCVARLLDDHVPLSPLED